MVTNKVTRNPIQSDIHVFWKTKHTIYLRERFHPDCAVRLHSHKNRETFYIRKGHGYIHFDQQIIEVRPGHLVVIPPGVIHGIETYDSELDCIVTLQGDDEKEIHQMYEWFCAQMTPHPIQPLP